MSAYYRFKGSIRQVMAAIMLPIDFAPKMPDADIIRLTAQDLITPILADTGINIDVVLDCVSHFCSPKIKPETKEALSMTLQGAAIDNLTPVHCNAIAEHVYQSITQSTGKLYRLFYNEGIGEVEVDIPRQTYACPRHTSADFERSITDGYKASWCYYQGSEGRVLSVNSIAFLSKEYDLLNEEMRNTPAGDLAAKAHIEAQLKQLSGVTGTSLSFFYYDDDDNLCGLSLAYLPYDPKKWNMVITKHVDKSLELRETIFYGHQNCIARAPDFKISPSFKKLDFSTMTTEMIAFANCGWLTPILSTLMNGNAVNLKVVEQAKIIVEDYPSNDHRKEGGGFKPPLSKAGAEFRMRRYLDKLSVLPPTDIIRVGQQFFKEKLLAGQAMTPSVEFDHRPYHQALAMLVKRLEKILPMTMLEQMNAYASLCEERRLYSLAPSKGYGYGIAGMGTAAVGSLFIPVVGQGMAAAGALTALGLFIGRQVKARSLQKGATNMDAKALTLCDTIHSQTERLPHVIRILSRPKGSVLTMEPEAVIRSMVLDGSERAPSSHSLLLRELSMPLHDLGIPDSGRVEEVMEGGEERKESAPLLDEAPPDWGGDEPDMSDMPQLEAMPGSEDEEALPLLERAGSFK